MGDVLIDGDPTPTPNSAPAATPDTSGQRIQALESKFDNLSSQLGDFAQQVVGALKTHQQTDTQPNSQLSNLADRLLTDPETVLNEHLEQWAKQKLGPYFQTQIADRHADLLVRHRQRITEEYGDGIFEAEFQPELETWLKQLPPEAKASAAAMETLIHNVEGRKAKTLREKATEQETKRVKEREAREAPPMLGRGARTPGKARISDEDREFARDYEKATGCELDLPAMHGLLDHRKGSGWTLADYNAWAAKQKPSQEAS